MGIACSSYLEIIQAQSSLLNVQLSKVADDFNKMQAVVNLYYALGGGVKLGTSGLIVAYREAAIDALAHCEEVTQQIEEIVTYDFTYPMMNDVMRIVKDMNPRILDQTFDNTCSIKLSIRKSEAEQLRSRLKKLSFE